MKTMSAYQDKADTDGCHFCAKHRDIEVHHIVPQRFNGSDNRENLVAVCNRCHKKLESLYDKRFYEKLGIEDENGERKAHFECLTCSDRAQVRMFTGRTSEWFCKDCAIECAERVTKRRVGRYSVQEAAECLIVQEVIGDESAEEMERKLAEKITPTQTQYE